MKEEFKKQFKSLSQEQQKKILSWYEIYSVDSLVRMAKEFATEQIRYADQKDYGYGEMGFYFKELREEMEEEYFLKPIAKEYAKLAEFYFDKLVEVKEI